MLVAMTFAALVLRVAQPALTSKALLLARNVVRHARKGLTGDDDLAGGDLGKGVGGVDPKVLDVGP